MNNADVAWMLVSTALVLLMTPALAFFYGGLVRSKNALNTMMMSFISFGFAGVAWALLGYSLAFAPGTSLVGGLDFSLLRGVSAGAAGHDSPPAVHGVPGHLRDHHGRADLGRDRRADAVRRVPHLHHALGTRGLCARRATGCGAAAGWRPWARSTSPAARSCTSTPRAAALVAALVRRAALRLRPAGDAAAQRAVRAARRRAALVRVVRLQRRQRARRERDRRPRLRQHHARARGDAGRLDRCSTSFATGGSPRSVPPRRSSSAWSRSRRPLDSSVRCRALAARRGLAAVPSYFAIMFRARTRLDDSLDVVAAHGVGGTVGALLTGVFADAGLERCRRRTRRRQRRAARHPGGRGRCRAGLQRGDDLRPA